jgi:hypothetical protein
MTRLRGVLNKALVETLKACNFDAFCECFPALADVNPEALRDAHEKVCEFLSVEVNVGLWLLPALIPFARDAPFLRLGYDDSFLTLLSTLERV